LNDYHGAVRGGVQDHINRLFTLTRHVRQGIQPLNRMVGVQLKWEHINSYIALVAKTILLIGMFLPMVVYGSALDVVNTINHKQEPVNEYALKTTSNNSKGDC